MSYAQKKSLFQDFRKSLASLCSIKDVSAWPKLLLVSGTSEYLVHKTTTAIQAAWQKHSRLPVSSIDSIDLDQQLIEQITCQQDMFSNGSLFILRRVDQRKDLSDLLSSIDSPQRLINNIIMTYCGKQTEAMRKLVAKMKIETIKCSEPKRNEYKFFIESLAKKQRLALDQESLNYILSVVGENMSAIENEINKLSLIFGTDSSKITINDLKGSIGYQREDLAFRLSDHLLRSELSKAHLLITDLIRRGESPLAILGLLARHFRLSLHIGYLQSQGIVPKEVARLAGLQTFQVNQYTKYCRQIATSKLKAALVRCQRVDSQLKSSKVEPAILLGGVVECLR